MKRNVPMDDLISIIIPVYNGELYIERCIAAIERQTYKKYEVLIINDGSVDRTEELCLKLRKSSSYIRYYYQENAGAGAARNSGIEKAAGKYILFLDCDDYIHPAYIEELYTLMIRCDAEIVCCSYFKGSFEDLKKFLNFNDTGHFKVFSQQEALSALFYRKEIMGYPYCKLFKRKIIGEVVFDANMRLGEDFKFVFDVLCKAKSIVYLDRRLYFYYQNNKGITHTLKYPDMKNAWHMIKDEMLIQMKNKSKELEKAVLSKLLILALDDLIKMKNMEEDTIFKKELYDFINGNCIKVFTDKECKYSNRILAGLCRVNISGTVWSCLFCLKIFKRLGIKMNKAV